jgi:hypothetical protein
MAFSDQLPFVPRLLVFTAACSLLASGQTPSDPPPLQPQPGTPDKRIFGVLPNYRTAESTADVEPLTPKQKFTIAAKDSFDWPSYILAGGLAGLSQLENSVPSFGQGMEGYAKRYAGGVGDQIIGNMMTEAIFPSFLHEDPRYFRRGYGSKWSRIFYAASRVLVTRTDAGNWRFNYSEVLGNATSVAISNSYYPDNRTVGANVEKLGQQIGIDAISQVLKEFWPDIKRKILQRHKDEAQLH